VVTGVIDPEVDRRRDSGAWTEDEVVRHFQVLFHESARVEIRFNEEIGRCELPVR